MQADLAEADLELCAFRDWRRRGELLALAFLEHDEVIEMRVVLPDEIEPAARLLLELDESCRTRPEQERCDLRRDLDAVRLMP